MVNLRNISLYQRGKIFYSVSEDKRKRNIHVVICITSIILRWHELVLLVHLLNVCQNQIKVSPLKTETYVRA